MILESPKMAEMDLKTTTSTMEALVRISVSIHLVHRRVYYFGVSAADLLFVIYFLCTTKYLKKKKN